MRRTLCRALMILAVAAGSATQAAAQDYTWSAGWNAGVLYSTSLNSGSGQPELDLAPDASWSVGFHVDRWATSGRVGAAVQGSLSEHTVPWNQGDRGISLYSFDASVLLRPAAPSMSNKVSVYLQAGVGLTRWAFGDGPTTTFPAGGASYDGSEGFELMGVAGVGFDIQTGRSWGDGPMVLRISGRDEVHRSPFESLNPDGGDFGMVHNVRISIGLHTGGGTLFR